MKRLKFLKTDWYVLLEMALLAALVALCCGCSLVSWKTQRLPELDPLPPVPQELMESERRLGRYVQDELELVREAAPEKHQPTIAQMEQALKASRARLGEPAEPVPTVPLGELSRHVEREIRRLGGLLRQLRTAEAEWAARYELKRREPMRSEGAVGRMSGWILPAVLVLLLLGGAGVPVGTLLARALLRLWRQAQAFRRVLRGVQNYKDSNGGAPALGEYLREATTPRDRETIGKTKAEEGI